ncbi:hypothetical protein [Beduini massiliensis]|uniref:hypothetical protein n=1 Tax=Beduini massiliensis TaxID=1585974 RepID=UPI00059A91D4|nr:hypothetical protein [Beduini massiliensis]
MKKYEYVSLSYSASNMVTAVMNQHRNIIDQYARERLVDIGMIPTEISTHSCLRQIDRIFEKGE